MFYYRVFGMLVRSPVDFPELVGSTAEEWERGSSRQIEVEFGATPLELAQPRSVFGWIEANKTHALFKVAGRGRILASDGKRICIELDAPEKLPELHPYMMTCGFATLAFHRGWIPLHVGAVRSPKGVILFAGPSGAGKSTTTTAVAKLNGWELLADDMVVLEPSSTPTIHLGSKRIKLWEGAAQALQIDTSGLAQDFFRPFKYHAQIEPFDSFPQSEVVGLVRLCWGEATQYQPKNQAFAFQELINSVYPTYFGAIYLAPSIRDATLQQFFPISISGAMIRSEGGAIRSSLSEVAEAIRVLVLNT